MQSGLVTLSGSGALGLRMGMKMVGDSTSVVFEMVDGYLCILADLD
jgi:hypothetical protein